MTMVLTILQTGDFRVISRIMYYNHDISILSSLGKKGQERIPLIE
jgi:hypothetical protein